MEDHNTGPSAFDQQNDGGHILIMQSDQLDLSSQIRKDNGFVNTNIDQVSYTSQEFGFSGTIRLCSFNILI